jgi:uncharacterized protein
MSFAHTIRARKQGLTILPTEACNFACHYCHQPHTPNHMGPEVLRSIVRFVERKAPALDRLDISWFGGEPLANKKAVLELSEEFVRICEEEDVELYGFMSTNAYLLTRQLFVQLLGLGVRRYQITFDGPQDVHDVFRVAQGGGATFAKIWGHVASFRHVDDSFEILVRVHVRPDTVESVAEFVRCLNQELGTDSRFKVMVVDVNRWGGPNDASIPLFEDAASALAPLNALIDAPHRCDVEEQYCNAADPSHIVIRPDGAVLKCAHALDLEENIIGRLTPEGQFVYRPGTIDFWIRGMQTGDKDALQCPRNGLQQTYPASRLVRRPSPGAGRAP